MAQYLNKVSQQTSRNACYDGTWATYLATSNGLFLNLEKIDVQKGKDQPVQYIGKIWLSKIVRNWFDTPSFCKSDKRGFLVKAKLLSGLFWGMNHYKSI